MWDEIKKVIDTIGGKFVIAESGKPRYIVLGFEEFKKLTLQKNSAPDESRNPHGIEQRIVTTQSAGFEEDDIESINQKIEDLTQEEEEGKKIKMEDLPF